MVFVGSVLKRLLQCSSRMLITAIWPHVVGRDYVNLNFAQGQQQCLSTHLVFVKCVFKSLLQVPCNRLVTIRLHVVGGVYVEGAVTPHH